MINVNGKITVGRIVNMPGSTYNGRAQEKYNVILRGWIARNEDKSLFLFLDPDEMEERKFVRRSMDGLYGCWFLTHPLITDKEVMLDKKLFPDIKWEDEYPTEVQVKIM